MIHPDQIFHHPPCYYERQILMLQIQGIHVLRNEAYLIYAAMTKKEGQHSRWGIRICRLPLFFFKTPGQQVPHGVLAWFILVQDLVDLFQDRHLNSHLFGKIPGG